MEKVKTLDSVFDLLDSMALSKAMDVLESFGAAHPELAIEARLRTIRGDYGLMFDYWSKGYKDEQLERVYRSMLMDMYRLTADVYIMYAISHSPYLSAIYNRVRSAGRDWAWASVCAELEGFVSDVAVLEFEHENIRAEKKKALFARHQQYMNDLFDYIWTSPQWTESMADGVARILISPTVDIVDQQLIVSAVMLGCMNIFDINKFRVLITVYGQATDEHLRQRSLVGWVLSLAGGHHSANSEERIMINSLLNNVSVRKELVELQIQLLYCVSAESDNKTIQKEIMPELLKHGGLNITPNGIEERDGTTLENIINPEEAERNMERVEESFRRMLDMQKAGADIYFGGFSQMKRFPFFDSISNWLVPFHADHPAISATYGSQTVGNIVRNIVEHMPFCDSDKYSFVLAFKQVADRIPQNIREMLSGENVAGMDIVGADKQCSPAYIRRIYLQDLYRFFRLFPSRSLLSNPFEKSDNGSDAGYVFFSNSIFNCTSLERYFSDVVACMMKRSMTAEAVGVLGNCSEGGRDFQFYMFAGNIQLSRHGKEPYRQLPPALECFEKALVLRPDSEQALNGRARVLFYEEEYEASLADFKRLTEKFPERMSYELNMAVCMVNLGKYEEALKHLYKMNYERPNDTRVSRVLARSLMCIGQFDKAEKIYSQLCSSLEIEEDDVLNRGLCCWLAGKVSDAASHLAEYVMRKGGGSSLHDCYSVYDANVAIGERKLLADNSVTPTEIHLMGDFICNLIFPAK